MTDDEIVDLMTISSANHLGIEADLTDDPNTPTVRGIMRAILDALREAGVKL